jgi:hypothetical protein
MLRHQARALRGVGDFDSAEQAAISGRYTLQFGHVLFVLMLSGCAWFVLEPAIPNLLVDFRVNIWEPGRDVLAGENPFRNRATEGAVYPPAAFVATLPISLLPYELAAPVWFVSTVGAVIAGLWLCGVRDWRCMAVALVSPIVIFGLVYGNVSMLFVLGVAGVWSLRQRALGGVLLGSMVASKLFLLPLFAWLLFSRRFRPLVAAFASTALFTLGGWLAVGVRTADDLLSATRENVDRYVADGSSVAALAAQTGLSTRVASIVAAFAGLGVLALAWRFRADERYCFTLAVVASLCASPLVWPHYYAILLVPLALAHPALSTAWAAPFVTVPQLDISAKTLGAISGLVFAGATLRVVRRAQAMVPATTRSLRGRSGSSGR